MKIQESELKRKVKVLKKEAGSHSPSIFTFRQKIPELEIKVDACFLSNPYATELFLKYFNEEVVKTGKIRDLLEYYPSQNSIIAELLVNLLNIPKDYIFVGNGAIEIIQAIIHNYTRQRIVIVIPTFSSYYEFVKSNVDIVYYKLDKSNDFLMDIDDYIEFVKSVKPDTIVLINPNNPNGAFISVSDIKRILEELNFVENIIFDESFIHFAYENEALEPVSIYGLIQEYENLIIIKSMSKDFGIAGIRAGYGIMQPNRVKDLLKTGFLWNSNGLAEYFFRLYTRTDFAEDYEIVRRNYIKITQDFINELKEINGLKVYPSKANFVLIELLKDMNSDDFVEEMLVEHGVYLRTGSDKIGLEGQFVRLASRKSEENKFIIDTIKKFMTI